MERMSGIMRILRWVVVGIIALAVTLAAAVAIFTRTSRFNDLLRLRIVDYLGQTYRGEITIGAIEGSIWGSLTLRDINVRHRGVDIASISRLRIGYYLLPALHGRIVLSDIDVVKPRVRLAHDPDGQWNLIAALAERQASPPSAPTNVTVALRRVAIEQANISVTTDPANTFQLSDGNFGGWGNIQPSGQSFNLDSITFTLNGPGLIPVHARGAIDYNEAVQVATITVPNFSLSTDRSQIDLHGTLRDFSDKNIDAAINLRKLSAFDVNSLLPQAHVATDLSGTIQLSGHASALRGVIVLIAGTAGLQARVQGDSTQPQPTWSIQANLTKIELRKLLKPKQPEDLPAGVLNATVNAQGVGASPRSAKGGLDGRITGLAIQGLKLGDLSIAVALDRQVANLKTLLTGPNGRAQINGRVDIAKVPAYNLTLALNHLRPTNLIRTGSVPSADLNLTAAIQGSGYQPGTMRARAQVRCLPSRLGAVRIDSGRISAQLESGIVQIADATLKARNSTLALNGQVALDPRRNGRLQYQATVAQAADWLALLGHQGGGQIKLDGRAEGNLRQLRTWGSAELATVKFDRYSVGHAHLNYDLAGLGKPLRPDGKLTLTSSDLHAGIELKSLQSNIRLITGATQTATITVAAEDRFSHPASLRVEISYRPALLALNLTQMEVATSRGSWQLNTPAQLTRRGPTVEIRHFAVANQNQTVTLDGMFGQTGSQDLTLRVHQLHLADLSGFLPSPGQLVGQASAQVRVSGTGAAPLIAATADIGDLKVANLPQAQLSARLSYADGRAQGSATLTQDATHALNATAELPLQLSWARRFESRVIGDIDMRAVSSGLDLAVLNTFTNRQLSGVGGNLSLDVGAHGPLQHPIPRGYIRLSDVRALAKSLKVAVTGGAADIQLGPGAVRLASLSAKAGSGTLTGDGSLTLEPNGTPGQLNIHIALDQWPAIATHEYKATVSERIEVTGPLAALLLSGKINVLYGVFRPDLTMTGSAPRADKTIVVVQRWTVGNPRRAASRPLHPNATSLPTPQNLAIDLDVLIQRDTWIKTPDFAVELEGDVHVRKKRGGELILFGTIDTVRGTLVVAQSQFDLTRGRIMFTGGHDINPELHLVAQRRVQNYLLSATIEGTANKPSLTLSSIPELPQADILSVMMFGKTSSNLSGGQQKDLQNQAVSIAGGYAASQIGQAVAKSLGLEELGVTTNSGGVGFGRYLGRNVYVSASQSASNMQDRKAEVQYYLTPSVSLDTSASTNYGNEIKLQWHKDY
jgi:autotransporter translocation and assembly factor TamB